MTARLSTVAWFSPENTSLGMMMKILKSHGDGEILVKYMVHVRRAIKCYWHISGRISDRKIIEALLGVVL